MFTCFYNLLERHLLVILEIEIFFIMSEKEYMIVDNSHKT